MCILELSKKVQKATKNRTHIQRVELLRQAKIIDQEGYYSEEFFSIETVTKDKKLKAAIQI